MDKHFLYKYFSGKTTLLEKSRIEEWLKDQDNQELFFQALEEWERNNAQYIPGKKTFWDIIDQKTNSECRESMLFPEKTTGRKIRHRRLLWMVAASILMIIVSGFLLKDDIVYRSYTTSYGETLTIELSDHSEIVLNANSTLKVPRWMKFMEAREVWVHGEAFFEISRTTNLKKFVVHTANMDVEVLGTRFNVDDRNESTRVVLQEGSVKVVSNQERSEVAYLEKPGDYAEVNTVSKKIVKKSVDQSLYTSWTEMRLKFENTPLPIVIQSIEEYYGIAIDSPDSSLLQRKFTGTLPNDNLDVILQALSNIYEEKFTAQMN